MKATHPKAIRGPGGLHCECCRIGSKKETRVVLNRITRRKNRQATNKIAKDDRFEPSYKTQFLPKGNDE